MQYQAINLAIFACRGLFTDSVDVSKLLHSGADAARMCRGAASIDSQEAHSHEHNHSECHPGHQFSDFHLGSPAEQEKVCMLANFA